jgi:hypothetical protein
METHRNGTTRTFEEVMTRWNKAELREIRDTKLGKVERDVNGRKNLKIRDANEEDFLN